MAANELEVIAAFTKLAQSAIGTAGTGYTRVSMVDKDMVDCEPVVEDDADETGKGHEFAEEAFLTAWNTKRKIGVYTSAEMLAFAAAFGLGTGTTSTFAPIDPVTNANEIDLPLTTFAEAIRPTGAAVLDRAYLDMAVEDFALALKNGAGRANSRLTINLVGSGKFSDPSGVSYPSKTTPNLLLSNSLIVTIHGVNYATEKNFESLDFSWKNNVRLNSGYFPGSDFQTPGDPTTGAVRGRMEFGKRELMLKFVTRLKATSTEFAKLVAQSSGTVSIALSGANATSATIALPQIKYKTNKIDSSDGIVTVEVECSAQVPSGQTVADLVTINVSHTLGTIGRA